MKNIDFTQAELITLQNELHDMGGVPNTQSIFEKVEEAIHTPDKITERSLPISVVASLLKGNLTIINDARISTATTGILFFEDIELEPRFCTNTGRLLGKLHTKSPHTVDGDPLIRVPANENLPSILDMVYQSEHDYWYMESSELYVTLDNPYSRPTFEVRPN